MGRILIGKATHVPHLPASWGTLCYLERFIARLTFFSNLRPKMLDKVDGKYTDIDLDALRRAMVIAQRDPLRAGQLQEMLGRRAWAAVAEFAAYGCQRRALKLKPWQSPPCCCDNDPKDRDAVLLLDEMLAAGVSQWEPDPMAALARQRKK
jgi:hypothetical protein